MVVLFLLSGFSCNHPDALAPKPYLAWIKKHHKKLIAKQELEGISYALTYRPVDLLVLSELGDRPSQSDFFQLRKEYQDLQYFTLRIQGNQDMMKYGIRSEDDYYQRLDYFAFYAQQDIQLIIAQDTLPCAMYHFERNYGGAPFLSLNLGFEVPEESRGDRSVAFYDRVYTGKLILLELAQEELNHIPKLQI